jgi:hypothetical protein
MWPGQKVVRLFAVGDELDVVFHPTFAQLPQEQFTIIGIVFDNQYPDRSVARIRISHCQSMIQFCGKKSKGCFTVLLQPCLPM